MSEVLHGKIISKSVVVVRFVEEEARVPVILEKVKLAMGNEEDYALTDCMGNEILESEGTTGKYFTLNFHIFICAKYI